MFAQVTPPVEIAAWLGCLTFLVMLANGVLKLVDRAKGRPTPGEVQSEAAEKFTRKEEFERHVAEMGKVLAEQRRQRDEDLRNAAQARSAMHRDITAIDNKLAALTATNQLQNQTLAGVTTDIKKILERLPRLRSHD